MNDKSISSQQQAYLIFLLLVGSSLVFITGNAAAQDAWIATLLGSGAGLYVLYTIIKLHDMFPGQRITQISTTVLGKIPGTFLNALFLWGTFAILATFLFDIIMLLEITYPLLPRTILYPLLVLPCCYCLYKGFSGLGRLGEVIIWVTFLSLGLGFLVALPLIELGNLKPILTAWKPLVAGTLYTADWPFDEVVIFALFLPMVSDLKKNKSKLYFGYLLGALFLLISGFLIIATLGAKLADLSQFPLFEVSRLAGFGDFQRVELIFFLLWFVTGIMTIMIYYQGLNLIVQDLFALKNDKTLILPLGLCLVVFTLYMFPNTVEYSLMSFKYLPVYTFPVNLLYPTILLCAAKFRQKQLQQKAV